VDISLIWRLAARKRARRPEISLRVEAKALRAADERRQTDFLICVHLPLIMFLLLECLKPIPRSRQYIHRARILGALQE
jgi:hypothetical protein